MDASKYVAEELSRIADNKLRPLIATVQGELAAIKREEEAHKASVEKHHQTIEACQKAMTEAKAELVDTERSLTKAIKPANS